MGKKSKTQAPGRAAAPAKAAPPAAPVVDRGPEWADNAIPLAALGVGIVLVGCCVLVGAVLIVGVLVAQGTNPFAPPFEGGAATLEYPAGGINLMYPADWAVDYSEGQVVLSDSEDGLDIQNGVGGALIVIFVGSVDDMQISVGGNASSAEDLIDTATAAGWFDAVGVPETRRFDTQEGLGVPIVIEEAPGVQGYLAAFSDGETAAVIIALSDEETWEENWSIFDAIMDSMVFYLPRAVERGELDMGETESVTLDPGGADGWFYQSGGDEYVTVTVTAIDDWDPTLEAFDEDGDSVGFNDDANYFDPALMNLYLAEPGRYEFRVTTYSGTGRYEIRLTEAEAPGGGNIDYGETVSGSVDWPSEREEWRFEGREGDTITISMVGQGDELADTYLELYGPDGILLTEDDDSGEGLSALIEEYELPESGEYRIIARAYSTGTGSYELTLTVGQ